MRNLIACTLILFQFGELIASDVKITNFGSGKTPDAAHVLSRRRPAAVSRQALSSSRATDTF